MIKELGLVVTGVTIGVVGTLYVTKDFLIEGFAHKLSEVIDEEVQDMKDELYNEQVERDNKRDYAKPLRKSSRYPWGEEKTIKRSYSEGKDSKPLRKSSRYPWGEEKTIKRSYSEGDYTKPLRKSGRYPWGEEKTIKRSYSEGDYTKPLRKSGRYPWGEEKTIKRSYSEGEDSKSLRKSGRYPWGEEKTIKRSYSEGEDSKSFLVAILDTREEAEKVLSELDEHIDVYGYATISDYYELVDIEHNYADHQYGWTGLSEAVVVPREHGYVVKLPVAKKLNK